MIKLTVNDMLVTRLMGRLVMHRPESLLPLEGRLPSGRRPILRTVGTLHRSLYQWSGGRVGSNLRGRPVLLLTTTGRNTGRERTWPLCYFTAGDVVVLVASAAGDHRHPAWYRNLVANPKVVVQVGQRRLRMVARTAEKSERVRLWKRVLRHFPMCAAYQRRTSRDIPVVLLHPATDSHSLFEPALMPDSRCAA